jgi:hypothetical protein
MDLTKPPDKILALSIAGVVVLIWLLVWLFGPKPEPVEPAAKLPISLADLQPQKLPQEEETVGEKIPETWGRDPFETPYQLQVEDTKIPADKGGKPGPQPVKEGQEYKLSTILISGTMRLAVIDDRVYGVGDQIGEEKISSITLDHVVLTGVQGERVLEVPQPQTKVTVESTGRK